VSDEISNETFSALDSVQYAIRIVTQCKCCDAVVVAVCMHTIAELHTHTRSKLPTQSDVKFAHIFPTMQFFVKDTS
jgi:hypothetical protein